MHSTPTPDAQTLIFLPAGSFKGLLDNNRDFEKREKLKPSYSIYSGAFTKESLGPACCKRKPTSKEEKSS